MIVADQYTQAEIRVNAPDLGTYACIIGCMKLTRAARRPSACTPDTTAEYVGVDAATSTVATFQGGDISRRYGKHLTNYVPVILGVP